MKIFFEPDGVRLEADSSSTILQTSLQAGLPHTHVCGGHARCSTCRVLVLEGLQHCRPRNQKERRLAERLQFEPRVRLACQTAADGDLVIRRLVLDSLDVRNTNQLMRQNQASIAGCEKRVSVLFSDIRNFTTLSEALYPYDVIHLLNRYFAAMLTRIEARQGRVDNLIGDGIMAVFGEQQPEGAALNAVRAGLDMSEAADEFARYVADVYSWPGFQVGIGVHTGLAVIGTVGGGNTRRLTAIGDSVNLASRVESANKEAGTRFLISQATYEEVKGQVDVGPAVEMKLKGKSGRFLLHPVLGLARPDTKLQS